MPEPAARLVDTADWHDAVAGAVADGYRFLDFLSAVDEPPMVRVVLHLVDVDRRPLRHCWLGTVLAESPDPTISTVSDVLPAAAWHERELYEMFGITVSGHPGLAPLLLPDGFQGRPLRKGFPLAARSADWPGANEPETHGRRRRRAPEPLGRGPEAAG